MRAARGRASVAEKRLRPLASKTQVDSRMHADQKIPSERKGFFVFTAAREI
jgi:hypothetical protein